MTKKGQKLEAAFKRLEGIVEELEVGDLALEESLKIFEEGIKLSRFCSTKLDEAEKRIEILIEGEGGKLEAVPMEDEEASVSPPPPPPEDNEESADDDSEEADKNDADRSDGGGLF